jgi:hypothetical protein
MRQDGYNDCIRIVTWARWSWLSHKRIFRRLSRKGHGGARGTEVCYSRYLLGLWKRAGAPLGIRRSRKGPSADDQEHSAAGNSLQRALFPLLVPASIAQTYFTFYHEQRKHLSTPLDRCLPSNAGISLQELHVQMSFFQGWVVIVYSEASQSRLGP